MSTSDIIRLVGVYDADGSLRGEVAYTVAKLLGRRHCALCDITHGATRERPDWRACRDALPIPFVVLHRDELSTSRHAATEGKLPVVFAELRNRETVRLLDEVALNECVGNPERLMKALEAAAGQAGLSWPIFDGEGTTSPA